MGAIRRFSFNRVLSAQIILTVLLSIYGATLYAAPQKKSLLIQGTPLTNVTVGQDYSFVPTVKSKNRAKLIFTIINKPAWVLFDAKTGGMSGKPTAANIGVTKGIVIAGKDRKRRNLKLPAFDLTVLPSAKTPVANGTPVNTTVGNSNGSVPSATGNNTAAQSTTPITIDNPAPSPTVPVEAQPTSPVINGNPTTSPTVPEVTQPSNPVNPTTPAMALENALQTGDSSKVTTDALLNAGIAQAQSEGNYCSTELAKLYPSTLQQTLFPSRSAYMASNSPRNVPLHAANTNGSIKVYSWIGKKAAGTPYAVLGTNVFSFTTVNTEIKSSTLNLFRWLLKKDASIDILSQPLVVLVPNSSDRTALQTWFTANGLSHKWTISSNAALLDSGKYDLYLANMPDNGDSVDVAQAEVTNLRRAFSANKPVLVFNNWYHPNNLVLAEFDLTWSWYGGQTTGNFASVTEQCTKASTGPQIQELFANLQAGMPAFKYESTDCPSNVGTVSCDLTKVTDSTGKSVETSFNQGANAIRSQLQALDSSGINLFSLGDDKRLLKLAVLLADKYRDNIQYPMDKVTTDSSTFYRALFADNAVDYARPDNLFQPEMGDFTDAQVALNTAPVTSTTVSYTPTVFDEWTSTGLYAPPGKTITVRRTDSGTSEVKIRFNFLRESTRLWNPNKYSRPRYMSSPSITLKAGQTYTFSTPYGGPIYLGWSAVQTGATPFTIELNNVLDNPLLDAFDDASINLFLNEVETTNSDWVDIKTPFAEIHTLKANMLSSFKKQDDNSNNGYTLMDVQAYIDDLNHYLILGNYAYAGFTGAGLPQLNAEVQSFCSAFQLTNVAYDGSTKNLCTDAVIHAKPKIQHINSDVNAACGALCSGNPFDSGSPIDPLGWGENHEMGHNLQRGRLNIYGRSGEVSNNIFPLHTQWSWTVAKGLSKHPSQIRPANQGAFTILQNTIKAGTAANVSHPLWSGTGTYDNAFERLSFYMQLPYTQQSWDIYTKMYLLERIYSDAIKSDAKWNAVKDRLGFGAYTRANATSITAEDFMYVAASTISGVNYSDFFEAWGIGITQAAKDQVSANNILTQVPKLFYYVNNELPAVMPTIADTIPLNGTNLWADPTP